jgi:hypothetical protein
VDGPSGSSGSDALRRCPVPPVAMSDLGAVGAAHGSLSAFGTDDVIRPHESTEPKLKLNRAQRRASGWRGRGLNGKG